MQALALILDQLLRFPHYSSCSLSLWFLEDGCFNSVSSISILLPLLSYFQYSSYTFVKYFFSLSFHPLKFNLLSASSYFCTGLLFCLPLCDIVHSGHRYLTIGLCPISSVGNQPSLATYVMQSAAHLYLLLLLSLSLLLLCISLPHFSFCSFFVQHVVLRTISYLNYHLFLSHPNRI